MSLDRWGQSQPLNATEAANAMLAIYSTARLALLVHRGRVSSPGPGTPRTRRERFSVPAELEGVQLAVEHALDLVFLDLIRGGVLAPGQQEEGQCRK